MKACHSSGKTFAAALAVIWFVTRYPDGIVITTAPTWTQVEKLLWGYIKQALHRSRIQYPVEPNLTEWNLGDGNYAIGLSTNEADRFSGFHAKRMLIILDEAPGVRPQVWEAIEGIRSGGIVTVLTLGNPVIASGPFYESHTSQRHSWATSTISAFDTPNLSNLIGRKKLNGASDAELVERLLSGLSEDDLDVNIRPYLVSRRWVWEKWDEWGANGNPLWDARVMGRFPKQSTDALLPLAWVEMAAARDTMFKKKANVKIGIDVAGPGEAETVMYIVDGDNIAGIHAFNDPDPRGKVLNVLREWKHRKPQVNCDSVGLGHYFTEHIRDHGFNVVAVNVGERPRDKDQYYNLKAELYWGLRERFEEGVVNGVLDEKTISQLTSIKYKHDSRGRVVVESKDDMLKRGVRSPDRAEALMLAYAPETSDGSGFACV